MRESRFALETCAELYDAECADLRVVYRADAEGIRVETIDVIGYADAETDEGTKLAHPIRISRDRLVPGEMQDVLEHCAADFKRRKPTIDQLRSVWPLPWSSRAG